MWNYVYIAQMKQQAVQGKKWYCSGYKDSKRLCSLSYHSIRWYYGKGNGTLANMEYILQAKGNAAAGVTWTTTCKGTDASLFPANFLRKCHKMTSYALLHTQRVTAKNGEVFTISPDLWERNQQQQSLLLRYFALPLKEENNRLWLGVDSLQSFSL